MFINCLSETQNLSFVSSLRTRYFITKRISSSFFIILMQCFEIKCQTPPWRGARRSPEIVKALLDTIDARCKKLSCAIFHSKSIQSFSMDRHHPLSASFHGSMRSRESSSTAGSDAREKIKDCCRKFIAFMFTQVGVGALVVCYAILGAAGFMHIEKDSPDKQLHEVRKWRQNCAEELWNITVKINMFNETAWMLTVNEVLKVYQNNITAAVHTGYSGRTAEDIWSFPAALMYSLSVFTMIGYGNIVPKTVWGKLVTIAYACFGIPIYVLYFCNMGKVLAKTFKWLYITAHECSRRDDTLFEDGEVSPVKRKITVPSTACLWVISFYILTGTIMFGAWEKWNYLDSTYFCVISLCKIGFGDFVPGANISDSAGGSHLKLVINFIYVLLGMGLVAMCYNLMCEDVRVKVRELRQDLKNCLDDITLKITVCMNDTKYYHQKQNRHIK